jgi:hypothetical protein
MRGRRSSLRIDRFATSAKADDDGWRSPSGKVNAGLDLLPHFEEEYDDVQKT